MRATNQTCDAQLRLAKRRMRDSQIRGDNKDFVHKSFYAWIHFFLSGEFSLATGWECENPLNNATRPILSKPTID